jgi:hypothetical protein
MDTRVFVGALAVGCLFYQMAARAGSVELMRLIGLLLVVLMVVAALPTSPGVAGIIVGLYLIGLVTNRTSELEEIKDAQGWGYFGSLALIGWVLWCLARGSL